MPGLLVLYVTSAQGVTYASPFTCTAAANSNDTHHIVQCRTPAGAGTGLQFAVGLLTQNSSVTLTSRAYAPPVLSSVVMPNPSGLSTLGGETVRAVARVGRCR